MVLPTAPHERLTPPKCGITQGNHALTDPDRWRLAAKTQVAELFNFALTAARKQHEQDVVDVASKCPKNTLQSVGHILNTYLNPFATRPYPSQHVCRLGCAMTDYEMMLQDHTGILVQHCVLLLPASPSSYGQKRLGKDGTQVHILT